MKCLEKAVCWNINWNKSLKLTKKQGKKSHRYPGKSLSQWSPVKKWLVLHLTYQVAYYYCLKTLPLNSFIIVIISYSIGSCCQKAVHIPPHKGEPASCRLSSSLALPQSESRSSLTRRLKQVAWVSVYLFVVFLKVQIKYLVVAIYI